jgi:hypothetical protein
MVPHISGCGFQYLPYPNHPTSTPSPSCWHKYTPEVFLLPRRSSQQICNNSGKWSIGIGREKRKNKKFGQRQNVTEREMTLWMEALDKNKMSVRLCGKFSLFHSRGSSFSIISTPLLCYCLSRMNSRPFIQKAKTMTEIAGKMSTFQFTNHFGVYFWWVLQKSQFIVARTKNNEIGTTFSLNWSKKWPPVMGRFGRFYKKKCCQVWLGSPWPTQHQIDRTELPWENVSRIMSSFKTIKKFRTASCWTIWQRQEQLFC